LSSAIVRVPATPERPWELDNEAITILKNSVAKGASDEELKYCLTVARRYKLDPFKQQIWFVKRWDSSADNGHGGKGAYVWNPQVGINGLLFAAARDHKSMFGSVSLPEFGPMQTQEWTNDKGKTLTFNAPEWARVKVWKKGEPEPTEAQAWWDEYAPFDLAKAPFWRKMPRRMIAKCATALAIRQAYPDLGGVYIPEECERMNEDFTPEGRQIVEAPSGGSHAAAQAVLAEKLAGTRPLAPSEPEKPILEPPKAIPPPPLQFKGTVEIDYTNEAWPIVRGDLAEILDALKAACPTMDWGKDEFFHVQPRDIEALKFKCRALAYQIKEVMPKRSPDLPSSGARAPEPSPKGASAETTATPRRSQPPEGTAAPAVVGTIERVHPDVKYSVITLVTKDGKRPTWKCFDKDINEILAKNIGKVAEVILQSRESKGVTYTNLVGLKRVGNQEYENGKVPVLQNKDREAGARTLF
jgi:hypothetical protein